MKTIPSGGPWITEKELRYVADACENGWYEHFSDYLTKFEKELARYTGTKYCIATSSCTGALHLCMAALELKPGDEVIVPEVTWIATVTGVVHAGAKPVFVDVEPDTWCLDPQAFKNAITSRTKAVIPVHMYGHPADMKAINSIASAHGITVIEDAAPGIGSKIDGLPVGQFGTAATFSFQGAKPLVMGEGGAIVTNDASFYDRAFYYWDHCRDKNKVLYNTGIGFKYKLANILGALGLAQLERAEEIINHRREIFFWYRERLGNIPGLRLNVERPGIYNSFYVPTMILDKDFGISPEDLMKQMDAAGVKNRPFFRSLSKMPMFSPAITPVADHLAARGINLPCASRLQQDDVEYVAQVIKKLLKLG